MKRTLALIGIFVLVITMGLVNAEMPPTVDGHHKILNLSEGHGYFNRLHIGNESPLDLGFQFHVRGDSLITGAMNVTGNIIGANFIGDGSQLTGIDNPTPYGISSNGLIGYWTGENNALDYSGNGYDGTLAGDTTYSDGIFGTGFEFDGSGDNVNMGDIDAMDWAVEDSWFVSARIKFVAESGTRVIISKGGGKSKWMGTSYKFR